MGKAQKAVKAHSTSRDSIDDIAQYYQSNSEDNRWQIQQLEFAVTSHLLKKYIPYPSRVFEIGAGSGRFTLALAHNRHEITALELVPELTKINQERLMSLGLSGKVTFLTGDAREVVPETKGPFDVALAMGPFYHLVSLREQMSLLAAIKKTVRRGGYVITTHLTRFGLMGYMMTRFPEWAMYSPQEVDQIMNEGYLTNHPRNGEFRGYFTTVDEIRELHEGRGLEVVQMHSQDPCIGSVDEIFNNLPNELKARWTQVLVGLSEDPMALGSGRSILCVSKV